MALKESMTMILGLIFQDGFPDARNQGRDTALASSSPMSSYITAVPSLLSS